MLSNIETKEQLKIVRYVNNDLNNLYLNTLHVIDKYSDDSFTCLSKSINDDKINITLKTSIDSKIPYDVSKCLFIDLPDKYKITNLVLPKHLNSKSHNYYIFSIYLR